MQKVDALKFFCIAAGIVHADPFFAHNIQDSPAAIKRIIRRSFQDSPQNRKQCAVIRLFGLASPCKFLEGSVLACVL
jgi:hypothetical protein